MSIGHIIVKCANSATNVLIVSRNTVFPQYIFWSTFPFLVFPFFSLISSPSSEAYLQYPLSYARGNVRILNAFDAAQWEIYNGYRYLKKSLSIYDEIFDFSYENVCGAFVLPYVASIRVFSKNARKRPAFFKMQASHRTKS